MVIGYCMDVGNSKNDSMVVKNTLILYQHQMTEYNRSAGIYSLLPKRHLHQTRINLLVKIPENLIMKDSAQTDIGNQKCNI